ncbi:hypothetical protein MTO96_038784 [Rhipicephalus appendiculatus]
MCLANKPPTQARKKQALGSSLSVPSPRQRASPNAGSFMRKQKLHRMLSETPNSGPKAQQATREEDDRDRRKQPVLSGHAQCRPGRDVQLTVKCCVRERECMPAAVLVCSNGRAPA